MKIFHYEEEAIICNHLLLSAKINGTQGGRMHCMHCGMPKGTLWAEVTLNTEIKSST